VRQRRRREVAEESKGEDGKGGEDVSIAYTVYRYYTLYLPYVVIQTDSERFTNALPHLTTLSIRDTHHTTYSHPSCT